MTLTPHPRSFFACAALMREHFEYTDYCFAASRPIRVNDDEAASRIQRYYGLGYRSEGYSLLVETDLRTFVPPKAIASSEGQSYIARQARELERSDRVRIQLEGRKYAYQPPRVDIDEDKQAQERVSFRPSRDTRTSIIVGAYLSLRDNERTWGAAADLLNRGVPAGKAGKINDGHVRNALRGGVRLAGRYLNPCYPDCDLLPWTRALLDWQLFDHMWASAQAYHQPSNVTLASIEQLRPTGLLEEWRGAAESNVMPAQPSQGARAAMLRTYISVLKAQQQKAGLRNAL